MGVKELLLIGTFLMTSCPVYPLSCLPCSQVQCPEPVNCKGGVIDSVCGCCKVCAKVEGERCGGHWNFMGRCDTGLSCIVKDGRTFGGMGFCEPVMCKRKRCRIHEVCTVGVNGQPKCKCTISCNMYLNERVCGYHNGKQYNNECELYRDECISGSNIGLMQGFCKRCFHRGKTFRFGETRRGKNSCEVCRCFHGEWNCTVESDCPQVSAQSCSMSPDVNARTIQPSCPKGYRCKVQIPGIPEANIPEVAVCVPGNSSDSDPTVTEAHPSTPARLTDGDRRDKIPFQCLLDRDEGPCRAAFQRWYYDKTREKCMVFQYGGCEGNANNFYTKTACKNFCVQRNRTAAVQMLRQTTAPHPENVLTQEPLPLWKEACKLPPVTGPCRASFHRWYYNHTKRKCLKFTYGGCNGNVNNFRTKDECKKRCMRKKVYPTTSVSSLPPSITASVNSANTFFCRCTQCWGQDRCSTSVGCFSIVNPDVMEGRPTKGCFFKSEEYLRQCSQNHNQPQQNTMECCREDMCNDFVVSEDSSKQRHSAIDTSATPSPKLLASIVKCHDSPSNRLYGEGESWEPNDCTVCVCRNGLAECLATVCRHPDCQEPLYIKGQCCPVCPLISNSSDHNEAALIKAFADNKLDTVLVSINHGHQRDVCRDIRSGQMYLVGQSWQLDHCTTCYCGKSGKAACAVQMCERDPQCKNLFHDQNHCCPMCKDDHVVRSTSQCYDTVTQKYYREAELWQRDECTSCYCGSDRKPACTNTICPPLECDTPLKIEKRCCLICPDTIKQGCMYDGKKFLHGDLKLLSDQCTLCKCENGDWHCSKNSCHARQVQQDEGEG